MSSLSFALTNSLDIVRPCHVLFLFLSTTRRRLCPFRFTRVPKQTTPNAYRTFFLDITVSSCFILFIHNKYYKIRNIFLFMICCSFLISKLTVNMNAYCLCVVVERYTRACICGHADCFACTHRNAFILVERRRRNHIQYSCMRELCKRCNFVRLVLGVAVSEKTKVTKRYVVVFVCFFFFITRPTRAVIHRFLLYARNLTSYHNHHP